jgi:hypothetical protein
VFCLYSKARPKGHYQTAIDFLLLQRQKLHCVFQNICLGAADFINQNSNLNL